MRGMEILCAASVTATITPVSCSGRNPFGTITYIPIVPNGFIPSLNDEFGLEFGLDFTFTFLSDTYAYRDQNVLVGFGIPADAMWDFHFSPRFDAYAKLGFVFGTVFSENYGGFWWTVRTAVGLRLKLNEVLYFRAEVGYPAIMAGLGFAF